MCRRKKIKIFFLDFEWRADWRTSICMSRVPLILVPVTPILLLLLLARFPWSELGKIIGKYYLKLSQYLSALKCLWKYFESNINTATEDTDRKCKYGPLEICSVSRWVSPFFVLPFPPHTTPPPLNDFVFFLLVISIWLVSEKWHRRNEKKKEERHSLAHPIPQTHLPFCVYTKTEKRKVSYEIIFLFFST